MQNNEKNSVPLNSTGRVTVSHSSLGPLLLTLTHYSPMLLFYTPWKHQDLSILPSGSFLGIGWIVFLKLSMMLEAHVVLCVLEPDFWEKQYFCPQNGVKIGFLNLLENLVIIFFWIRSLKNVYINCCILAQIPYLGKICFLRYVPERSQPIRLQDFLSLEQNDENKMKKPDFLCVVTDSWKLKVDEKILG